MLKKIVILLAFFMPIVAIGIQTLSADEAFSLLTYRHSFKLSSESDVLMNLILQSKENNLAIISVPLLIPEEPVSGNLSLKIKESGSDNWLYISTYSGILAVKDEQLFGFPPIVNSKSKRYNIVLKLDSKNGSHLNIDQSRPIRSKYKFDEVAITDGAPSLTSFVLKKFLFATQNNPYFIFTTFVYWLPATIILLFFSRNMFSRFLFQKWNSSSQLSTFIFRRGLALLSVTLLSTILDIFVFPQYQNALVTIVLFFLWMTLVVKKTVSRLVLFLILVFLVITTQLSFYVLFLDSNFPQKAGAWVLILLTVLIVNDIDFLFKTKYNKRSA